MEVLNFCKLYKGGDSNPYKPTEVPKEKWAEEYLKFHIWDAEYSLVHNYSWWQEVWEEQSSYTNISEEEKEEEIFKFVIKVKLRKMTRPDIDFTKMYFEL